MEWFCADVGSLEIRLFGNQMDPCTDISGSSFHGAALRSVGKATIQQFALESADVFADGTAQVPSGRRPSHWTPKVLQLSELIDSLRALKQFNSVDGYNRK